MSLTTLDNRASHKRPLIASTHEMYNTHCEHAKKTSEDTRHFHVATLEERRRRVNNIVNNNNNNNTSAPRNTQPRQHFHSATPQPQHHDHAFVVNITHSYRQPPQSSLSVLIPSSSSHLQQPQKHKCASSSSPNARHARAPCTSGTHRAVTRSSTVSTLLRVRTG
jgi:hypothetical protein